MEEFRDVPGYEGLYQVSNLGNVKSLSRLVKRCGYFLCKERILKNGLSKNGYYTVALSGKSYYVHKLVAMTFLNHKPCGYKLVIDHINDNQLDNRVENLQLVTQRENVCKTQGRYSSKYKGVNWHKDHKKWMCSIYMNGKKKHLGYFDCELKAHLVYQNKLKEII